MSTLLMHCRPGFEGKVCVEIAECAATFETPGYTKSKPANVHVEFVCQSANSAERLMRRPHFTGLTFPRQWAHELSFIELPESQRIEVLLTGLASYSVRGSPWLEVLDTDVDREVSIFCHKFKKPPRATLVKAGWLQENPALSYLLLASRFDREVFVDLAEPRDDVPQLVGIPRLKLLREASSRLALKLEGAWHQFIPRNERDKRPAPDMLAADLGATPDDWTR